MTRKVSLRWALRSLLMFVAAGSVSAPAVRADFPFPPTPREVHRELHSLVHDVLRVLDRIPVEIRVEHRRDLEVFFTGYNYDRGHRHSHATYRFPVWIDGEVEYLPYVYCDDHLYGAYTSRPQFWRGWGHESEGRWCQAHRAWYPGSHSCFRPHGVDPRLHVYGSYAPDHREWREAPRYQGHVEHRESWNGYRSDRTPYPGAHAYGRPDYGDRGGWRRDGHRDGHGDGDRYGHRADRYRESAPRHHRHDSSCHHDRDGGRH